MAMELKDAQVFPPDAYKVEAKQELSEAANLSPMTTSALQEIACGSVCTLPFAWLRL